MPLLPYLRFSTKPAHWSNYDTAQVDAWLSSDDAAPFIERLVHAWNDGGGLGVELADELQDFTRTRLAETMPGVLVRWRLRNVNWNQLAEQYAEKFLNITEDELTARRESLLQ